MSLSDNLRRLARERVPTNSCHSFAGAEEAATGTPWACAPSLVRRLDAVSDKAVDTD